MKKLADIIKNGESETLEFKECFNADAIETAVAFANTRGGRILIGISDTGRPVGQPFGKEALRDHVNRIATATEPSVIPEAESLSTPEGNLIMLSVPEFPLKPVATRGRCYRRSGSTTRQMTPSEIAEMHIHSTGQSMDSIIVHGKGKSDIDFNRVQAYMDQATAEGRRSFTSHDDPWQVLKKLELVKSESEITRAAILLFGTNPQSPLSQAVVHAGRLRKKVHIMDNRIVGGSIIDQVEDTVDFIKKNLHVRFEITGEPQRKEVWDYPLTAVREAVVNAICHRDYGDVADIQIKIFEDALQVWSPGFLPYGMTVQDLFDPEHSSKPRNKLIAQVFYDLRLIERYGSGIHRILDACQEAELPQPVLENFSGGFRIKFILPEQIAQAGSLETVNGGANGGANGGVNGGVNTVFELIKAQPGLKSSELRDKAEMSQRTIERHLNNLKKRKLIRFVGAPKTGGYYPTSANTGKPNDDVAPPRHQEPRTR